MYSTVCPRRSDPFYIVTYIENGSLLLGHTVSDLLLVVGEGEGADAGLAPGERVQQGQRERSPNLKIKENSFRRRKKAPVLFRPYFVL